MVRARNCKSWVLIFLILAAAAIPLLGQTASATVSGRVTDSAGAVMVGATVELTSIERGTVSTAPTNDLGLYTFPSVQPGAYRLVARSTGFKQAEAQNLIVEVGSQVEQNFQLEIG